MAPDTWTDSCMFKKMTSLIIILFQIYYLIQI